MMHFIKNLVLLPFKLAWDIFLILGTILVQIVWLGLLFNIFGLFMLLCLLSVELLAIALCPLGLLLFLKHPWPMRPPPQPDRPKRKKSRSAKATGTAKKSPSVERSCSLRPSLYFQA